MRSRSRAFPAWLEGERSLLAYLARPHEGHAYLEDLLDAVALMTSWVLVGMSVMLVLGVLLNGLVW